MPFAKMFYSLWKMAAVVAVLLLAGTLAHAQQAATVAAGQQKIDQLVKLLDDPEVRALLAQRPSGTATAMMPNMSASALTTLLNGVQGHLLAVREAIPLVPGEFSRAGTTIMAGIDNRSATHVFLLFLLLVALGLAAEFGFSLLVGHLHAGRSAIPGNPTPVRSIHTLGRHLFGELAPLVIFAIASVGMFLMVTWPPLLLDLIVPTLLGLIAARLVIRLCRVVLVPSTASAAVTRLRLIPMDDAAAQFWFSRVVVFTLTFFVGWAAEGIMGALGFLPPVRAAVGYAIGVGLLAIAIEIVWRRPRPIDRPRHQGVFHWLATFWLCVIWALWVAGLNVMMLLCTYVIVIPAALRISSGIVRSAFATQGSPGGADSPVYQVLVERGLRATIIAVAILWLTIIVSLQTSAMVENAQVAGIIRGALTGIVILLAADIVWQIAKALINHRLTLARAHEGNDAEVARSGRLLTLLPIFRNFLAMLIIAISAMMVLSALGIEVGPLIAGAGIFGVAIGFGSQTLVKDIISGIFYMTDDAFRVGEYIQSGTYKGTVESFSLRSVRLRHHRGPIFTVPFGVLGAVENMSRDWVIDKFLISVSYETDVGLVKKLVKGIGSELLEDPELGPKIIETLKMKGVEQFGDYGINLSFAVMAKPGEQSMIRRRALALIREAFTANGIEFASPTVRVGNDERAAEAVAALTSNNNALAQKKLAGEAAQ